MVFVQYARIGQLCTEVQSGLSAEIRKQCIRTLLCDDLFQTLHIQWLNVCDIRDLRVCHDRCRVGIDQNDLVT